VHDLDHVQVNGLLGLHDAAHCVCSDFGKLVSHAGFKLGAKGSLGNLKQGVPVSSYVSLRNFEFIEELKTLLLGQIKAIGNNTRVETFIQVTLSLVEQFTTE
jgi:hypothetical protein